jgi:HEPN domain-containing protein
MKPREEELRQLVSEWTQKADLDFEAMMHLAAEPRFRDVAAFHAQQAAEKYLKALLTRHQTEFPKTHLIQPLLFLLEKHEPGLADRLNEAAWLGPFGVTIRYPGDMPETLPGDEQRAVQLATLVREAVLQRLNDW